MRRRVQALWVGVVCGMLGMTVNTPAQGPRTGTWNVDADGNWNTGSNWDISPNFPNSDKDTAIFGNVITADRTVTLGQNISVRYLTFNDDNQYTITGGNTLLIDGPGANGGIITQSGSGDVLIESTVSNGASSSKIMEWTGTGTGLLTISGVVTGAAQITKNGTSTFVVSGNNTFTGAVTINAGAINVQNANGLGTTAGGVTVANGAQLQIQGDIGIGTEAVTINGTGLSSTGAIRNVSGNNSLAGNISIQTASSIGSDAGTLTISGVISSTGANTLTKVGAGTITLTGNNTYTGGTIISAGTLEAGAAGALGGTTGVTLNSGGTLLFSGSGNRVNDSATITMAGGTISANNATETMGAMTLTSNSTINLVADSTNGDLTFSTASVSGTPVLVINNWQGIAYTSGTGDRIFMTTDPGATFLAQVQFYGPNGTFDLGAIRLPSGEIVPIPEPSSLVAGIFLAAMAGFGALLRRLR